MSDWISVKDKLPNDKQEVMLYAKSVNNGSDIFAVCEYCKFTNEFNQYDMLTEDYCYPTVEVTHWMPLSPPKA